MFSWMIQNFKVTIAIFTTIITVIAVPLWLSAFGFIVDTKTANAAIFKHEERILKLEKSTENINGQFQIIQGYLQRIEEREFQELKQARQSRQASKP